MNTGRGAASARVGGVDRVTCASVARRAPGRSPKAGSAAEAGPAAERSGAALISCSRIRRCCYARR
jgi:hypothetical protein